MFAFGMPSALAVSKAGRRQTEGNTQAGGRQDTLLSHVKTDGRQVEGDHAFEMPST